MPKFHIIMALRGVWSVCPTGFPSNRIFQCFCPRFTVQLQESWTDSVQLRFWVGQNSNQKICQFLGIWHLGVLTCENLSVWASGRLEIWGSGCLDIWVYGHLGVWASGYLGICVSGHLGIWASGYLDQTSDLYQDKTRQAFLRSCLVLSCQHFVKKRLSLVRQDLTREDSTKNGDNWQALVNCLTSPCQHPDKGLSPTWQVGWVRCYRMLSAHCLLWSTNDRDVFYEVSAS